VKPTLRVLRAASIWASFLSSSALAFADDSPTQKVRSAEAEASSGKQNANAGPAVESSEQRAATAYQDALASYAKGDVTAALDKMRESYRLSQRAELLYNLAQLEEELKACDDALADYRRYLELVPRGRYRESAELAERRLVEECPPPAAVAPASSVASPDEAHPPSAEHEQEPPYWTSARVIGWSAITVGTLSAAGALFCQLQAIQAKDALQQSVDDALAGGPSVDESLQARQHRYNHAAIGLGITAGALVTTGALVLLLDPGKAGQRLHGASVYALPGLVGASYAQRF
jgi:hypothetical protein